LKKKIIIASSDAITQNLFLTKLTKYIQLKGHKTILLCRDPRNLKINNSKKIKILFPKTISELLNFKNIFLQIYKIYKINKQLSQPIFLLNTPLAAHFIRLALYFSKPNIIYFVHGYRFHPQNKILKNFLFKFLEYIFSFNTNKYININKHDFIFTKNILKKKNILINGVGIKLNKKIKNKKINFKKKIIGVLAAYKNEKGYLDLIYISEKLNKYNPNFEIRAFGNGNRSKYMSIIKKKKLKNIKLYNFRYDILNEIKKFDILLHASFREGLPVSVIQSLSLGKPVIGRKIRGNIDLIKNGINGFLYQNVDEAFFKIKKLLTDQLLYKKFSRNAKETITDTYKHNFINNKIYDFIKN